MFEWLEVVKRKKNTFAFPPLLCCESSISRKEDPDRKKKLWNTSGC